MTNEHRVRDASYWCEVRLLLEELCCDFCRFEHSGKHRLALGRIRIDREYYLGKPNTFADVHVQPVNAAPYFVEVKFGYSNEALLRTLRRKYKSNAPGVRHVHRLVIVIDTIDRPDWKKTAALIRKSIRPSMKLEFWDEAKLLRLLKNCFQIDAAELTPDNLLDIRQEIDRAKGYLAFGADAPEKYVHDPLRAELMWHLGFWKIRELREAGSLRAREIMPPGIYRNVVVLLADLCSFSSYVRDTPNTEIVRENLTNFYSKSRYQIINSGGMMYQIVGDQVVGFFGLPAQNPNVPEDALHTARRLVEIGYSVSNHWQRRIDRMQTSGGLHVGMAVGDIEIVSLRPFSRTHMGGIGDCINVAARLMALAGPGEIVATNTFYQSLNVPEQAPFSEIQPVEAKNVGKIKAWKFVPPR
ncbi:MAG: adenylate/guanylate cyclase domain-containing protein [Gemmataceae bacterium]